MKQALPGAWPSGISLTAANTWFSTQAHAKVCAADRVDPPTRGCEAECCRMLIPLRGMHATVPCAIRVRQYAQQCTARCRSSAQFSVATSMRRHSNAALRRSLRSHAACNEQHRRSSVARHARRSAIRRAQCFHRAPSHTRPRIPVPAKKKSADGSAGLARCSSRNSVKIRAARGARGRRGIRRAMWVRVRVGVRDICTSLGFEGRELTLLPGQNRACIET